MSGSLLRARLLAVALLLAPACGTDPGGAPAEPEAAAATEGPRAVLSWEARNEDGVYGYLIYRAATRAGPYLRLNDEIVHVAAGDDGATHRYSYVDTEVRPGGTYFYYLDIVGVDGRKRRFSGVISKVVDRD